MGGGIPAHFIFVQQVRVVPLQQWHPLQLPSLTEQVHVGNSFSYND